MVKEHKKESMFHLIYRYFMILIGASMAALSIELILIPNSTIDGGIIGVSLLVNNLTSISFGILVVIFNIPFLFSGYKYIGKTFCISSIYGVVALAVVESQLHHLSPFILDPLLATVFGGLLLGAGVGIVIRFGGALDGTEILGIVLSKRLPFSVGEFVMFFNIFVFGWAGFVIGWEQALYSVLTYYIAYKTIDTVSQGVEDTKAIFIVSDHYEELSDAIISRLGRSVTKLNGKGGFLDNEKDIIYVVVTRLEISKLKSIVNELDANAFLTIMDTQEVHGAKFKSAIH
ncbi:YitT family protein [Bacillaceae bacterium Marseille-Q3522]|nr:YitT family protein [Bacillaceae bacterium Marseille-Q3522]